MAGAIAGFLVKNPKLESYTKQGRIEERTKYVDGLVAVFADKARRWAGVTYDVKGQENIPAEGAVVYAANHNSYFDAPIMMTQVRGMPGFLMKKELGKIPGARLWLESIGCIFVDRSDMRAAATALKEAEENVRNGISMAVFPEGTRSKDGKVGEFKGGAFKIAQRTGVPIVPVAIRGSADIFENHGNRITPGVIRMRILPPVEVKGLTRAQFKEVPEKVRKMIEDALDETKD